jgi:exopolyphosphatase / guanosine-5'-triphosphate,3'-diphosphate pyrophosphatase
VAEIVPRWEWRTFDADLGPAARSLAELTPDQVVESSELYVVPAAGGDVVKVRDGLMDVKHLHTVDADGLEQWSPVVKAPFIRPCVRSRCTRTVVVSPSAGAWRSSPT